MVIRRIDPNACTDCGICALVCPNDIIRMDPNGRPHIAYIEDCTACRLCEDRCGVDAIEVAPGAAKKASDLFAMRHLLLGLGIPLREGAGNDLGT